MFSGSKGVRPHLLNEVTAVCITVCNTLQRISFQHRETGGRTGLQGDPAWLQVLAGGQKPRET